MTTRIYLVRHGITIVGGEDRFAGEIDVPLSDAGREQARALGARLAAEPLDAAYASPLGRALETARLVAAPHGREVVPLAELREISHGHWEGKTRAEVERLDPLEYSRWESDPFSFAPAGGETGLAVTARATGPAGDRRVSSGRSCPRRLSQGDDPAADLHPPRVRRAKLPRPARSESGLPEHPGFPGLEPCAAHALQRHVALRRNGVGDAEDPGRAALEVVGPEGAGVIRLA